MMEIFKKKDIYFYIIFAYLFSMLARYIWVYQFSGMDSFYWNNQLMINTNDGYYFATVVKDLLFGTHPNNQLLSVALDTYPGTIYSIYWAVKLLPFSLDTIVLYAPAFISSLIVIPIILIMRLYSLSFIGFLAALLASITWSFYNRTMVGYFDTDMYALVFPVFIIYFMMKFVKEDNLNDIIVASVITSFYVIFYPQGYAAVTALFIGLVVYGIIFLKEKHNFFLAAIFMSLVLLKIMLIAKLFIIVALFFLVKHKLLKKGKNALALAVISVVVLIIVGDGYALIISKIGWYTKTGVEGGSLHFYDVAQTIREAGKIPFETFANRISGSIFTFIVAFAGYVFLVFKKREFLLFLPLVAMGFFAYIGGLRFTVYAIPAMSLGAVYFIYVLLTKIVVQKSLQYIGVTLFSFALLYPNIMHIISYKVPTVFSKKEVEVLDRLKNIASNKDYTLTWWDYGYPIWYYSDTNTLIDGGKHHHDNYIISKILTTTSAQVAANLARVSVEIYAKKNLAYSPVSKYIFEENGEVVDPNLVLEEMSLSDYPLPKKTRDIFLYLPNQMLNIFPTVNVFSNLDLQTGETGKPNLFYISQNFKQDKNVIYLGSGIKLFLDKGSIQIGEQITKLNHFAVTEYDKSGKLNVNDQILDTNSSINIIFMKNYNKFLVLDNKMYNSLYIQMYVLEHYDKALFEPTILTPLVKIYKVKI